VARSMSDESWSPREILDNDAMTDRLLHGKPAPKFMRVVAILETMWDWRAMTSSAGYTEAPRYFRIHRENYSGRRLYKLVGPNAKLLVTNACRELASGPEKHGRPDPIWLGENLRIIDGVGGTLPGGGIVPDREWPPIDVLLVCGGVAQKTYKACGYTPRAARVIEIPHPAARMVWTKQFIENTARRIQGSC